MDNTTIEASSLVVAAYKAIAVVVVEASTDNREGVISRVVAVASVAATNSHGSRTIVRAAAIAVVSS